MKNKKVNTQKVKKVPVKTIQKSIFNKSAVLLGVIVPVAALIAYSMDRNFFSVAIIISIFILLISIAAYVKEEVLYSDPKVINHGSKSVIKNSVVHKKYNNKFSLSLNKGTVQVLFSIIVIILVACLGQVIYKL